MREFWKNRRRLTCEACGTSRAGRTTGVERRTGKIQTPLTKIMCRLYIVSVMAIRLASLSLVLMIGGSVFGGFPMHSNEKECSMPEMAGMDCCKKAAQAEKLTPEVSTARLCCALNCSQSGTTGPSGSRLPRPSSQAVAIDFSSAQPPVSSLHLSRSSTWADHPPPYSNPAYIRHLALLI